MSFYTHHLFSTERRTFRDLSSKEQIEYLASKVALLDQECVALKEDSQREHIKHQACIRLLNEQTKLCACSNSESSEIISAVLDEVTSKAEPCAKQAIAQRKAAIEEAELAEKAALEEALLLKMYTEFLALDNKHRYNYGAPKLTIEEVPACIQQQYDALPEADRARPNALEDLVYVMDKQTCREAFLELAKEHNAYFNGMYLT